MQLRPGLELFTSDIIIWPLLNVQPHPTSLVKPEPPYKTTYNDLQRNRNDKLAYLLGGILHDKYSIFEFESLVLSLQVSALNTSVCSTLVRLDYNVYILLSSSHSPRPLFY
jgi:hypothetical protein